MREIGLVLWCACLLLFAPGTWAVIGDIDSWSKQAGTISNARPRVRDCSPERSPLVDAGPARRRERDPGRAAAREVAVDRFATPFGKG